MSPPVTIQPNSALLSLPPIQVPPPATAAIAPAPAPAPAPVSPVTSKPRPASSSRTIAAATRTGASETVTVQRGDTASKFAAIYKPADVSLDQMLVALLHGNEGAFMSGNVNRLKAGAVLTLPSDSQARATTADEASRSIKAQSNDFDSYRRRLAENAPASRASGADRQASGKLQASVEERNASASSPDKLKISQGDAAARTTDEKLVENRQAQETSNRANEVAKNLDDLKNSRPRVRLRQHRRPTPVPARVPANPQYRLHRPCLSLPSCRSPQPPLLLLRLRRQLRYRHRMPASSTICWTAH